MVRRVMPFWTLPERYATRCIAVLLLAILVGPLHAQTRHARRLGVEHGLNPSYVVSLAQDHDDLLWIGTGGGLYRYDGVEMRKWAPETLRSWVTAVSVSPTGEIAVVEEDRGGVFTVVPEGVRPVPGPDGTPVLGMHDLVFDSAGTLWTVGNDAFLSRDAAGAWAVYPRATLDGTWLHHVVALRSGGAAVITSRGVWRVAAGAPPRRIAEVDAPRHALELADGRLLVVTVGGELLEIANDRATVLVDLDTRGIEVVERHGTLWISFDYYLVSLEPGRVPEVLGPDDGIPGGGALLVDHEGSLWVASGAGLLHFPEPDTRIWTERHGLPTAHTRFLTHTGDTTWVSTWRGPAAIARTAGAWQVRPLPDGRWVRRVFADAAGALWIGSTASSPGIYRVSRGDTSHRYEPPAYLLAFAERADGSRWFGTLTGLLVARTPDAPPAPVTGLPFQSDSVSVNAVLHDRSGRTWLASERRICHADGVSATDLSGARWSCDEVPSGHHVASMLELSSGSVWASFVRGGVWAYRDGAWTLLGGNRHLPALDIHTLVPSPRGGVWIVGVGSASRVVEAPASADGFEIRESLSAWHGLGEWGGGDLIEQPDGTLWLASGVGVARIPAGARGRGGPPRRVVLVDAWVDDERVALDAGLALRHDRNRLTLRFAATSYRDPALLRYEVRISPDDPWQPVQGPPVFRWVDLRPGRYQAEVRASLDGTAWSAEPARFAFRVLPPWYLSPWALGLFALAAAGAVTALYRARVASLLQLERQRTRIAMDLHDEMGAGLGSIGILSGVLERDSEHGADRRKLAKQIAEISHELGTALSDIVWSLGPRSATLEEVAGRLAEHGARLFSDGAVQFTVRFPDAWPSASLDFPVRRGVLLIGLEALHNAARHARARHVTLAVHPANGRWRLTVEDDGCGLPDAARRGDGTGVGLQSLRRRAREIDASIAWAERPGGGTVVTLDFQPPARAIARG